MPMFGGHPTFKRREEQIGRYATQNPSKQQQMKVGGMLQQVDNDLQYAVDHAGLLPAELVDGRTQERRKDGAT